MQRHLLGTAKSGSSLSLLLSRRSAQHLPQVLYWTTRYVAHFTLPSISLIVQSCSQYVLPKAGPAAVLKRCRDSRATACRQGQTIYAYTAVEVNYHCTQLLKDPPSTVGFDIEWRVTYKAGEAPRKTALLQLCSRKQHGQYQCLLLHIAHSGITPALIQILGSEVCCRKHHSMISSLSADITARSKPYQFS